jgi:hypothetical protein
MSITTSDPSTNIQESECLDQEEHQQQDLPEENEKIMAIAFREKRLGCAILSNSNIYVMEELPEGKPFQLVILLVEQFMPTKLLLPSKCDFELINKYKVDGSDENETTENGIREIRPMSDFSVISAGIKMRHNGILMSEELIKKYPLSIGCIGALLCKLRNLNNTQYIGKIEWFSMYWHLFMDESVGTSI